MGYAERANDARRAARAISRVGNAGPKIALDVQHSGRGGIHAGDRGARFTNHAGGVAWESELAAAYARAARHELEAAGATVLTNGPNNLAGPYQARQREAGAWGAVAYLALHVNAGGGSYARASWPVPGFPGISYSQIERAAGLAQSLCTELRGLPGIKHADPLLLKRSDRGAVCIAWTPAPVAPILLEPFFGDGPALELLEAPGLKLVGEAIARGVLAWWKPPATPTG